MSATSKKRILAIYLTNANVTASSYTPNGASAIPKTGLAAAATSLTTPTAVAALFGTGYLSTVANIEAVVNIATQSTNRLLLVRLAPTALADTLAFTLTQSTTTRTGAVMDVTAFTDAGLVADAELAAIDDFTSAMSSLMQS